jgi:hypothetical protein
LGLSDVLAQVSPRGSLKTLIEQQFRESREVPPLTSDGYVRASGFADMCPREEVLCGLHEVTRTKTVDPGLNLIFTHGHSLHWGLQNIVLPKIGCLIGVWKCVKCMKRYGRYEQGVPLDSTLVRRPKACVCECEEFIYDEISLVNHEYRVTGHPDGFLVLPGLPSIGLFEAKSIGPKQAWMIKNGPLMGHVIQVQLYMWMTGVKWSKVLYWDKSKFGMDSLTEHQVDFSPETLEVLKKSLSSIWTGIQTGILPEKICTTESCPRATSCPVKSICFSEEHSEPKWSPSIPFPLE